MVAYCSLLFLDAHYVNRFGLQRHHYHYLNCPSWLIDQPAAEPASHWRENRRIQQSCADKKKSKGNKRGRRGSFQPGNRLYSSKQTATLFSASKLCCLVTVVSACKLFKIQKSMPSKDQTTAGGGSEKIILLL